MMRRSDLDTFDARGLALTLLAVALIAAVSPMWIMPGCGMSMQASDCQHGVITQHISELTPAQAGPVVAAVIAVFAVLMVGLRSPLQEVRAERLPDYEVDDPLGQRLRL